tara:strand:+ start:13770 stop:15194 length:1425 start_codon:yes stop_codon:yes gene_type:complete
MVQPNNYMLNVADPLDRAFQGYATGLNAQAGQQQLAMNAAREARAAELQPFAIEGAQLGLAGQRQGLDIQASQEARAVDQFGMEKQAAQTELDRKQQFNTRMGDLAALGNKATQEDYRSVMTEFPDFAKGLSDIWGSIGAEQQRGTAEVLGQAAAALKAGNTELAKELGTRFRDAATNSGNADQAAAADAMLKLMETSPEAAMVSLRAMLTQNAPDIADAIFVSGANNRVQSTQMIGGRISVQTMANGETRVIDTATGNQLEGDAAQQAITSAEQAVASQAGSVSGARSDASNQSDLTYSEQIARASARGNVLGKAEAENLASAATDQSKADYTISLIDDVLADDSLPSLLGAAQGRLPAGIPGVTGGQAGADLSAKLEQLQGQAFLQAFESLKGGGSITEREGGAATAAISRITNMRQSPEAYKQALTELRQIAENARARAAGYQVQEFVPNNPENKTTANPEQTRNSPSYLR